MALQDEPCEACRVGAPQVSAQETEELLGELPDWQVVEEDGIRKLRRSYSFADFARALAFTNRVGEIAEKEGHHPDLLTEWGKVTVTWWSHKIKGLHRTDFVMAAKTDAC